MKLLSALAVLAFAAATSDCRYDPVAQERIDALPDDGLPPGELHRAGQACLACHTKYEGSQPPLAAGGTIFSQDDAGALVPAPNVAVIIDDSAGDSRSVCTNAAGNFFIKQDDWADITFPLKVRAGARAMRSLIGRDASCASCHKLPSASSLNPKTGAGHDSAGVVLVDRGKADATCGGAP